MKTKVEILEEVAKAYNLNTRSIGVGGKCAYNGPEGKHCAFAMFVKEEDLKKLNNYEGKSVRHVLANISISILKEEYQIDDLYFWEDVQNFHDDMCNWTPNGLSEAGEKRFNLLKNRHA